MEKTSFLKALADRYGAVDSTEYTKNDFLVSTQKKRTPKSWEMVGLEQTREKQSQHAKLTVVSLPQAGIDIAEITPGEIADAKMTRLRDLDLSGNSITWDDVQAIVAALPNLTELQLNYIPLKGIALASPWTKLRTLTLNGTKLPWPVLKQLESVPQLESLHFESNDTVLTPVQMVLPNVSQLVLANNHLSSWSFDAVLATQFPALRDFGLHGNDLPEVEVAECDVVLSRLTSLWLSDNPRIRSLTTLRVLTTRCALSALRVTYDTMVGLPEAQSRMLVIATVPSLVSLNNGAVRPKERLDAELYYLQRSLATSDENQRQQEFPRWEELKAKYASVVMSSGEQKDGAMLSVMLRLTFRGIAKEPVTRTLPATLTVGKVKALISTLWPEADPRKQQLRFVAAENFGAPPQALQDDMAALGYYAVGDGAIIDVAW